MSTFFFYSETTTTEIYTLSLHDALPISEGDSAEPCEISHSGARRQQPAGRASAAGGMSGANASPARSEEHTSELQSQFHLVCRLLLEKKNNNLLDHTNYLEHVN